MGSVSVVEFSGNTKLPLMMDGSPNTEMDAINMRASAKSITTFTTLKFELIAIFGVFYGCSPTH